MCRKEIESRRRLTRRRLCRGKKGTKKGIRGLTRGPEDRGGGESTQPRRVETGMGRHTTVTKYGATELPRLPRQNSLVTLSAPS